MTVERLQIGIAQARDVVKVHIQEPFDVTYTVPLQRLERAAAEIRETLAELCLEFVHNEPPRRSSETADPVLLRQLAIRGDVLRRVFFDDAKVLDHGDALRKIAPNVPVSFVLQPGTQVHLPWGLMFDVPRTERRKWRFNTLTTPDLQRMFWCMQRDISVMYDWTDDESPLTHDGLTPAAAKLLGVFHVDAWRYADPNHAIQWPHEFDSLASFLEYLSSNDDDAWLLYFFCHAEENKLLIRNVISDTEEALVPDMFMNYISGGPSFRRRGLAILNGCKTGVPKGRRYTSWQEAMQYQGLLGCIATEAIVPTKFAWNFGVAFLRLVMDGETPERAMRALRTAHWPLSLLYGLYCVPETVLPSDEIRLPARVSVNYSHTLDVGNLPHATLPFAPQAAKGKRHRRGRLF